MKRLTLALLTACAFVGCLGSSPKRDSRNDRQGGDYGLFRVHLHDDPISIDGHVISAVNITVESVSIHGPGGWIDLSQNEPQKFDLLKLVNDASIVLGNAVLPAGMYQEIRLVLGQEHSISVDGAETPLKTQSGEQSGIKLKGPFTVSTGALTNITLDFDAAQSIQFNKGVGWSLKPVIGIESVTSQEGVVVADLVKAASGGLVAAPSGASVEIPPGALSKDTIIWIEQVEPTPAGLIPGPIHDFGPTGTVFTKPVKVTVPYVDEALPSWVPETGIEVASGYERLGSIAQDTVSNLITASDTHFTLKYPVVRYVYEQPVAGPTKIAAWNGGGLNFADGVYIVDRHTESTPLVYAYIDVTRPDIRIRGTTAPLANGGGTSDLDDDRYTLQNLKTILDGQPLRQQVEFAINGVEWRGFKLDGTVDDGGPLGLPARTLKTDGTYRRDLPETTPQVFFEASDNYGGTVSTAIRITKPEDALDLNTIFGSGTTVMWDGEYKSSKGVAHPPEKDLNGELKEKKPRTVVAIDKSGRLLLMVVGGDWSAGGSGMNLWDVYNQLVTLNAYRAILLDGGPSSQVAFRHTDNTTSVEQMLTGIIYPPYFPNGRPIISSLIVERSPHVDSIEVVDPPAKVGQFTTFNITGTHLPDSLVAFIPDCVPAVEGANQGTNKTQGNSSKRSFSCAFSGPAAERTGIIKNHANTSTVQGKQLASFTVNFVN